MKNNSVYRLYGRTKGRKKKNSDSSFLKLKLRELDQRKYNIIDVGAGFGESTIKLAKKNPENIIICCEKYIDGLKSLFNKSQKESISNIFIYQGNFLQMLEEYCKEDSISEIWILFPDPWPKRKHFKRRLIDKSFFIKIHKYLKNKSTINIATDSKSYVSQILRSIYLVKDEFLWLNQKKFDWDYNPEILPNTKYYRKALENGLNPFYVKLMKI